MRSFLCLFIFPLLRKVEAFVKISIVNVGDIDTVKQEFDCEFYLSIRWAEPRLEYDTQTGVVIETEPRWEQSIFFTNLIQHDLYEMNAEVKLPEMVGTETMKGVLEVENMCCDGWCVPVANGVAAK